MTPALLVIDMQNDFVAENAAIPVSGIRNGLEDFSRFVDLCRRSGIPVVYTRHCYDPARNPIEAQLFPELGTSGLRVETAGWEICDELRPREDDIVVDKTRYDAFFGTDLLGILRSKEIDSVIITGTMTEICCESTARSAMYSDFRVLFCSDLTFCSDPERQKNTLSVISSHFGQVMSTTDIERLLNLKGS